MTSPTTLRRKILEFLSSIPNINTERARQAFILDAYLDPRLEQQIEYIGSTDEFLKLLFSVLVRYGTLDDGRDPMSAILDVARARIGKDREEECSTLQREWTNFRQEGGAKSLVLENEASRQQYLEMLRDRVAYLNLSQIAAVSSGSVPLEGIYVPLPTNLSLGIKVHDYRVEDWWIGMDYEGTQLFSGIYFRKTDQRGYDASVINRITDEIQAFIDAKGGRISDEERERPLILAPLWENRVFENFAKLDVVDVASITKRLVVIGDPGSGKSTFAKFMTLCLLGSQLVPPIQGVSLDKLGHWPHGPLTPLFIELRRLVGWKDFPELDKTVTADDFWRYVRYEFLQSNNEFENELLANLKSGRGVIIFDGLDEVPFPLDQKGAEQKRKRQLIELAQSVGFRFRRSRIVFTSRPYGYQGLQEGFEREGFSSVELVPLDKKQILQLAVNLYKTTGKNDVEVLAKAKVFVKELRSVSNFLKDKPLFLTLMTALSLQRKEAGLPNRAGLLLQQSISLLLDRWTGVRFGEESARRLPKEETEDLYRKLELIAYNAHSGEDSARLDTPDIKIGEILGVLYHDYLDRVPEILNYLTQQAGIFDKISEEFYRFHHRTFQEFLAASHLARLNNLVRVREHIQENPAVWRQPGLLLGDVLEGDQLWNLLKTLVFYKQPDDPSSEMLHWYSIWLAAQILAERWLYAVPVEGYNELIVNELRKRLTVLIESGLSLPPGDRVQAGRALGFIGDPRDGVGVKNGLPDIAWVKIPAGKFVMGTGDEMMNNIIRSDWAKDWKSFDRETPAFEAKVSEFQIGRFPVTISQFRAFIDAEDGYYNQIWWPKIGWELHSRDGFKPDLCQKDPPNLPQYNVSWFEAVAFCNWLSRKLKKRVRLPTEVEWEWMARGTDSHIFPWGNQYDPSLCNVAETGIKWSSPVGCFIPPHNRWGKDGPLDICGNVWEWCSTVAEKEGGHSFKYPYNPDDGREDMELGNDFLRIVRGGSYSNVPILARNTFRGRDRPFYRRPRQGFRVVMELGLNDSRV